MKFQPPTHFSAIGKNVKIILGILHVRTRKPIWMKFLWEVVDYILPTIIFSYQSNYLKRCKYTKKTWKIEFTPLRYCRTSKNYHRCTSGLVVFKNFFKIFEEFVTLIRTKKFFGSINFFSFIDITDRRLLTEFMAKMFCLISSKCFYKLNFLEFCNHEVLFLQFKKNSKISSNERIELKFCTHIWKKKSWKIVSFDMFLHSRYVEHLWVLLVLY